MPSISNSKSRSIGRKMGNLSPTGSRLSIKNLLAQNSRRSNTSKSLSRKSMSKKSLERSLSNLRKNKKKGARKQPPRLKYGHVDFQSDQQLVDPMRGSFKNAKKIVGAAAGLPVQSDFGIHNIDIVQQRQDASNRDLQSLENTGAKASATQEHRSALTIQDQAYMDREEPTIFDNRQSYLKQSQASLFQNFADQASRSRSTSRKSPQGRQTQLSEQTNTTQKMSSPFHIRDRVGRTQIQDFVASQSPSPEPQIVRTSPSASTSFALSASKPFLRTQSTRLSRSPVRKRDGSPLSNSSQLLVYALHYEYKLMRKAVAALQQNAISKKSERINYKISKQRYVRSLQIKALRSIHTYFLNHFGHKNSKIQA